MRVEKISSARVLSYLQSVFAQHLAREGGETKFEFEYAPSVYNWPGLGDDELTLDLRFGSQIFTVRVTELTPTRSEEKEGEQG